MEQFRIEIDGPDHFIGASIEDGGIVIEVDDQEWGTPNYYHLSKEQLNEFIEKLQKLKEKLG